MRKMEVFGAPVSKDEAKLMNPVVLAFVGDAVYTVLVRRSLALSHSFHTGELNRLASERVCAEGQSAAVDALLSRFTEEEAEIYRRARNAKKPTKSKHASPVDYARSTGFEAVVGYLYLTGERERLFELFGAL